MAAVHLLHHLFSRHWTPIFPIVAPGDRSIDGNLDKRAIATKRTNLRWASKIHQLIGRSVVATSHDL